MKKMTRLFLQLQIEFHMRRIHQHRRKGERLLQTVDGPCSPQLLRLSRIIDHHGCLLRRLERRLNPVT